MPGRQRGSRKDFLAGTQGGTLTSDQIMAEQASTKIVLVRIVAPKVILGPLGREADSPSGRGTQSEHGGGLVRSRNYSIHDLKWGYPTLRLMLSTCILRTSRPPPSL